MRMFVSHHSGKTRTLILYTPEYIPRRTGRPASFGQPASAFIRFELSLYLRAKPVCKKHTYYNRRAPSCFLPAQICILTGAPLFLLAGPYLWATNTDQGQDRSTRETRPVPTKTSLGHTVLIGAGSPRTTRPDTLVHPRSQVTNNPPAVTNARHSHNSKIGHTPFAPYMSQPAGRLATPPSPLKSIQDVPRSQLKPVTMPGLSRNDTRVTSPAQTPLPAPLSCELVTDIPTPHQRFVSFYRVCCCTLLTTAHLPTKTDPTGSLIDARSRKPHTRATKTQRCACSNQRNLFQVALMVIATAVLDTIW